MNLTSIVTKKDLILKEFLLCIQCGTDWRERRRHVLPINYSSYGSQSFFM